jgi:hypothetical protein
MKTIYIDAVAFARAEFFRAPAFPMPRQKAVPVHSALRASGLDARALPVRTVRGGELCPQTGVGSLGLVPVIGVSRHESDHNSIPGSASGSPPV